MNPGAAADADPAPATALANRVLRAGQQAHWVLSQSPNSARGWAAHRRQLRATLHMQRRPCAHLRARPPFGEFRAPAGLASRRSPRASTCRTEALPRRSQGAGHDRRARCATAGSEPYVRIRPKAGSIAAAVCAARLRSRRCRRQGVQDALRADEHRQNHVGFKTQRASWRRRTRRRDGSAARAFSEPVVKTT